MPLPKETVTPRSPLISGALYQATGSKRHRPKRLRRHPQHPVLRHQYRPLEHLLLRLLRLCARAVQGVQPVLHPPPATKDTSVQ